MALANAVRNPRGRRRPDPLLRQAQLQSQVRFSPEESALRGLATQALQNLLTGVRIDKGVAAGIVQATRSAAPQIEQGYAQATGSVQAARQMIGEDMAKIASGAADPFRAAAAREQAGALVRLAEAEAGAKRELGERQVQAEQGRAFMGQHRQRQYQQEQGRIAQRLTDVARERGAFTEATYGDLRAKQAEAGEKARQQAFDNALKEAGIAISQGKLELGVAKLDEVMRHNQATEGISRDNANKPPSAEKRFGMSAEQRREFAAQVERARRLIVSNGEMRLKPSDRKVWSRVRQALLTGRYGKREGPAFDPAVVNAAFDFAIYGYLSPPNKQYLERHGIPGASRRYPRAQTVYGNPITGQAQA